LPNGPWCPQLAATSSPGSARPGRISPRARYLGAGAHYSQQ